MSPSAVNEILQGLSAPEKYISSKYFYDDKGSAIFQQIMEMPEYYLTNAEQEILAQQAAEIITETGFDGPFNVVELGAGDGSKTFELLSYLDSANREVTYVPVDISKAAIDGLAADFTKRLPRLKLNPKVGDYFEVLKDRLQSESNPSLLLFLGSNIGNYMPADALNLLRLFHQNMAAGDALLLGADLQKNPEVIRKAYDDPHGITRNFNLNLLDRFNRELNANFERDQFEFYCYYNPLSGEVRSYLVSLTDQIVDLADEQIRFKKDELIWTELSKKYSFQELEGMAQTAGFEVKKHFLDTRSYFTNSLWIKSD
ncbi:L-histidine N(alpha)-methyltransferase [Gilvibacter sp. SZ-19]|uniref:L-histidine N(alpha)-methyltransferase n=1 Tax=Gilvibacter sp. SZ-19 TaxID=754429 RepID=UPI000B3C1D77|nr:L-histidine N(alpha)-methyltransferase [Gilvibacter sp. SZ-19]ARV11693.1 L-histidine N(alpha)-methyltransferase [Gilvibacter sp. SZ-19]